LVVVVVTIYMFTGPFSFMYKYSSMSTRDSNSILQELNSTKAQLAASHTILSELHQRLNSTNLLVQALLIDLTREQEKQSNRADENTLIANLVNGDSNTAAATISDELSIALGPHKLPLGYSMKIGSIHMPVGEACLRLHEELKQYMRHMTLEVNVL
jgi:hypothetical protein